MKTLEHSSRVETRSLVQEMYDVWGWTRSSFWESLRCSMKKQYQLCFGGLTIIIVERSRASQWTGLPGRSCSHGVINRSVKTTICPTSSGVNKLLNNNTSIDFGWVMIRSPCWRPRNTIRGKSFLRYEQNHKCLYFFVCSTQCVHVSEFCGWKF